MELESSEALAYTEESGSSLIASTNAARVIGVDSADIIRVVSTGFSPAELRCVMF